MKTNQILCPEGRELSTHEMLRKECTCPICVTPMHVDYLTLACLRDDLDALLGARVQQVVLPDSHSVGLELYAGQRFYLFLSAHPKHARVLLSKDKLRRGVDTETPLLLLLRKWVRGARLVDIRQPPWERVLIFHFDGESGPCRLVAEIMERYGNIVLVGPDGCVLDALKRVGPQLNRYRVTLPAHPYRPPPVPPHRRPPVEIDWTGVLDGADPDQPLHHLLTRRLLAVSPTLAREIAARGTHDPRCLVGAASPDSLNAAADDLLEVLDDGTWKPHVALDEDDRVVAFTPYLPHQFGRVEPAPDISTAMARYFRENLAADTYAAARGQVQALIEAATHRIERALAQLQEQLVGQDEMKAWRQNGELLLAYQGQVPPGARQVTLTDHTGGQRAISLDPTLTPVENAQAYFDRYARARRGAKAIPARMKTLTNDRAYLEQLSADLSLAETRPDIDAVRHALTTAGWAPKQRHHRGPSSGPLHFRIGEFTIHVGRNARQNEEVTFKRAKPDDLWLHVRGQPGAHVIITSGKQTVPEELIQRSAELAAYHSTARRGDSQTAVDVTSRRFVRRVRGGHPGMVTYRNERTIWVKDPSAAPSIHQRTSPNDE